MGESFAVGSGTTSIGRGLTVDIRINDEGISRVHAAIVCRDGAYFVKDAGSTNGTFANGDRVDSPTPLREGDRIQLGATSILKFTHREDPEEDLQRRLVESALRDRETGLFNRSHLLNRLESDVTVALRQGKALSLVMFAFDGSRATRTPPVPRDPGTADPAAPEASGDPGLLRELAKRVQAITREDDVLGRYGPETLVLACRWVDAIRGARAAHRIREAIAGQPFLPARQPARPPARGGEPEPGTAAQERDPTATRPLDLSLSLGVADLGMLREATAEHLLAAAEAAMRLAARAGGDRVELYDPENEATHHG